jgi:hypothetical protein
VTTYQGNNKGALPCAKEEKAGEECLEPIKGGLEAGGSSFRDPSKGVAYRLEYVTQDNHPAELGLIQYAINAICPTGDKDSIEFSQDNPGSIVVATKLEDGMGYCQQA